jgi:hypothetical protein
MPEIDVDLSDVGHHITGLEAVLLQIFHLKMKQISYINYKKPKFFSKRPQVLRSRLPTGRLIF